MKRSIATLSGLGAAGAMLAASALPTAAQDAGGVSLLMFEQAGCVYCARWNEEVSPEYSITQEGQIAPLVRIDIHDPLPEAYNLVSDPVFTPTFVLVSDGDELGRIEGYPGEDFFWGLLGRLLDRLPSES
ncbi:hypothetical protein HKCCE4037_09735 [Rhodobacterales bacterium HKCCE4037]|nr:hypothetical protein [Rhodobacterales bacterium HKCCE4037]